MANPHKGEVDLVLFEDDPNLEKRSYVLKFTNSGHREMEDLLNIEQSEILARIDTGRIGPRIITALFYGATRRFHRRDFPTVAEIDDLMDEIDDEAENPDKEGERMAIALIAAYTRSNPSDIEARMMGEEPKAQDEVVSAGPKDQDKPTRKPRQKSTG